MSGCRSHAEQVGPYVLGALEPDEMDEMRVHLAELPAMRRRDAVALRAAGAAGPRPGRR